jgi:alkanesulfonate monooxygenase SsuD/methylene tetrahydromethanopterin reductase-like flavin-dependent oxidoreductase (luciferase family)
VRHGVVLFTGDRGIVPARAAQAAEAAGFDSFYVPEHTHIAVRREARIRGPAPASCPTTAICARSTAVWRSAPPPP